jgi:hypothetical protein
MALRPALSNGLPFSSVHSEMMFWNPEDTLIQILV